MTRILVFGDSVEYGAWDTEGGWVQRLKSFLTAKTMETEDEEVYFQVYNLGISGDTTEDLLRRLESEAKERYKDDRKMVFLVSIGLNDTQYYVKNERVRTEPDQLKENIRELIDMCKDFTEDVVFCGFTPVDEERVTPMPWSPDRYHKEETVGEYNDIVESVCEEEGIPFINIYDKFMETEYRDLLEDGVHPNSEGHRKIYETVRDFLLENRVISF